MTVTDGQAKGTLALTIEQEFVQRFADVWKHPSPERLVALLHPEVVLYQPYGQPIRGKAAARAEFERLLRWLPGLYGVVKRATGAQGVVFIEWQMHFPIGRQGLVIKAVDRFLLRDGLGIERAVYFNQLPLVAAIVANPQVWSGFIRYRYNRS
jgi:SnoaL-like domain